MTEALRQEIVEPGIMVLTFCQPERRNALDAAGYAALSQALTQADADPAVRVVVITGEGGHFTAGNNLAEFQGIGEDVTSLPAIALLAQMAQAKTPMIAAVEGVAVGIGTTMLFHCDLAYAGDGARFRAPFVPLGVTPEGGSSLLLPLLAGPKKAAEVLMLGDFFSAQQAADMGVINSVCEAGEALTVAMAKAKALCAQPPQALAATRALLRGPQQQTIVDAIKAEEKVFLERCRGEEAQTIIASFLNRAK